MAKKHLEGILHKTPSKIPGHENRPAASKSDLWKTITRLQEELSELREDRTRNLHEITSLKLRIANTEDIFGCDLDEFAGNVSKLISYALHMIPYLICPNNPCICARSKAVARVVSLLSNTRREFYQDRLGRIQEKLDSPCEVSEIEGECGGE